ncbi:uncharacterized protein N7458_001047 [Penicillium daleae]|uniref:BD-FAE-like domain-containing protein n=1 Tax=Penicillium daleae TaxID=63821 RepID=A0AAD6CA55_9EURO|nr:uncharacterized protein N7458_001047 [Penicillium daleae]KAJ5459495.1 hypothetical protein N7458_001047 [Penicillium daleae]
MDCLPAFGTGIYEVLVPTLEVYTPLIEANAARIDAASVQTYSYGEHPRQKLDIYLPTESGSSSTTPNPILVFLYGGGFTNGDKVNQNKPLFYRNLGYFFSQKGQLETIIIDYRLVKHGAKFPDGGEDLSEALAWVDRRYSGQKRPLFILGNSAGGMHACAWLFEPIFKDTRRALIESSNGIRITGIVLVGVLYHFGYSTASLKERLASYLGTELDHYSPMISARRCLESGELMSAGLPPVLVIDSELDPDDILRATQDFISVLRKSNYLEIKYLQAQGHNHISPPLALGTGIPGEEDWAFQVLSFINGLL